MNDCDGKPESALLEDAPLLVEVPVEIPVFQAAVSVLGGCDSLSA